MKSDVDAEEERGRKAGRDAKPDIEADQEGQVGGADIRIDEQHGVGGPDIKPEDAR
jgi:hypothetical protein